MDSMSSPKDNATNQNDMIHVCCKCNSVFDDSADIAAHKLQNYCTNITALDENCMDEIFKYLSVNDLAAISLTCKRYKELAERYFYLNRETEPIYIKCTVQRTEFTFQSDEYFAYEKQFASLIRSVYAYFDPPPINRNSFEFIQMNCAKQLRLLKLFIRDFESCVDSEIKVEYGELIKDKLKHLNVLEITNIFSDDLYASLLKHCENVQKLQIFLNCETDKIYQALDRIQNIYGNAWLNHSYPNLKTLTLCLPNIIPIDLTNFAQLNTQLIRFVSSNVTAIRSMCRSNWKLDYAALLFRNRERFMQCQSDIVEWCKRNPCKCLEVVLAFYFLTPEIFQTALHLQNIKSLHIFDMRDIFSANIQLSAPNITSLCIFYIGILTDEIASELEKFFPNLKKLNLRTTFSPAHELDIFKDNVIPIMNHFKHLEHLWYSYYAQLEFNANDINELNESRSKLMDACPLTIHVNSWNCGDVEEIYPKETNFIKIKSNWCPFCEHCANSDNCDADQRLNIPNTHPYETRIPEWEFEESLETSWDRT